MADHTFYQNKACAYFPCHKGADEGTFNCLFCYCPLYALGEHCGGHFTYTADGIKDCSACLIPHRKENYDRIVEKTAEIIALAKKKQA